MSATGRFGFLAIVAALVLAGACRRTPPPPDAHSLVEAERSFARAALTDGMKEAFLSYLGDGAIIFRPGPVDGRTWFEERPAASGFLAWEPQVAELSEAGDLGYTLGPWQLLPAKDSRDPVVHGHYVSVWKREPDGNLKVVLDVGVVHERLAKALREVVIAGGRRKPVTQHDQGKEALLAADRAFSDHAVSAGIIAAYMGRSADDLWLFRMNRLPIQGKEAVRSALAAGEEYRQFRPVAGEIAQSGDLGYTYGFSRRGRARDAKPGPDEDSYVRIWRRSGKGDFEVVVDVQSPLGETTAQNGQ